MKIDGIVLSEELFIEPNGKHFIIGLHGEKKKCMYFVPATSCKQINDSRLYRIEYVLTSIPLNT